MRTLENGGAVRPLLHAEALHKSYGAGRYAVKALDGVELEIKRGELLAILVRRAHRRAGL